MLLLLMMMMMMMMMMVGRIWMVGEDDPHVYHCVG
jgi:hypothetical protein